MGSEQILPNTSDSTPVKDFRKTFQAQLSLSSAMQSNNQMELIINELIWLVDF